MPTTLACGYKPSTITTLACAVTMSVCVCVYVCVRVCRAYECTYEFTQDTITPKFALFATLRSYIYDSPAKERKHLHHRGSAESNRDAKTQASPGPIKQIPNSKRHKTQCQRKLVIVLKRNFLHIAGQGMHKLFVEYTNSLGKIGIQEVNLSVVDINTLTNTRSHLQKKLLLPHFDIFTHSQSRQEKPLSGKTST